MAYTELYVTEAGSGAGDGSTPSDTLSWANMLADVTAGSVSFNIAGNAARGANTDVFTTAGTAAAPRRIRGMNTVAGDLEANGMTRGGGPVTTNFPEVAYTTGRLTLPNFCVTESMSFTSAATAATVTQGSVSTARRCTFANTHASSLTAIALTHGATTVIVDECSMSIASSGATAAAVTGVGAGVLSRCLITGNTAGAGCIKSTGAGLVLWNCMLRDAGYGITTTSHYAAIGCSFRNITNIYNDVTTSNGPIRLLNCVGWGTAGTSTWFSSTTTVRAIYANTNALGNFNANYTNAGDWPVYNGVAITVDPFTSSTDLTLNNTAGGGAACRAAGLPLYLDLGAWQTQATNAAPVMISGF